MDVRIFSSILRIYTFSMLLKTATTTLLLALSFVGAAPSGEVVEARQLALNLIPTIDFTQLNYSLTVDALFTNAMTGNFLSKPIFLGSSLKTVQISSINATLGFNTPFGALNDTQFTSLVHTFTPPLKLSRSGTPVDSGPVEFTWINHGGFAQAVNDGILSTTKMDLLSSTIHISLNGVITGPIFYNVHDVQSNIPTTWNILL